MNQEEIENINRPSTSTEIETEIKNLPTDRRGEAARGKAGLWSVEFRSLQV